MTPLWATLTQRDRYIYAPPKARRSYPSRQRIETKSPAQGATPFEPNRLIQPNSGPRVMQNTPLAQATPHQNRFVRPCPSERKREPRPRDSHRLHSSTSKRTKQRAPSRCRQRKPQPTKEDRGPHPRCHRLGFVSFLSFLPMQPVSYASIECLSLFFCTRGPILLPWDAIWWKDYQISGIHDDLLLILRL